MKKILISALSLSLLACACSPKVQGDNYEDLMSSAEKISKEGILDGDMEYRLLQPAINYLISECRRDGELKKHSIDDKSFDSSKKDTCAKELDGRRAKDLIQEARDDFGKFPRSSSLIEFIKRLDKDLFKEYEKNALTSWGDSDPKSLEKFLEERKKEFIQKEFIPMFEGTLRSCLEESTKEGFNKNKNTGKYINKLLSSINKLLSSFEHFDGLTIVEIYNISSPHDVAKEPLENCIQEHFSGKYVFDAIVDFIINPLFD